MFTPIDLTATLKSIPWFNELDAERLRRLGHCTTVRGLQAEEYLFCEGEDTECFYVVLDGRLAVEMLVPGRGRARIFVAEPLDVIGWSSLTPVVRQRTTSARALVASRVACLNGPQLTHLCEEDHELGYVVMRRLANIVASRYLVTRLTLMEMLNRPAYGQNVLKGYSE